MCNPTHATPDEASRPPADNFDDNDDTDVSDDDDMGGDPQVSELPGVLYKVGDKVSDPEPQLS